MIKDKERPVGSSKVYFLLSNYVFFLILMEIRKIAVCNNLNL